MRYIAVSALMVFAALWAACSEEPNGCEDARTSIQAQMKSLCQGDTADPAYVNSPFCTCCVANGLYSVDSECACRSLIFDTDACYYSTDVQALPQVRDAIEYANSICRGRQATIPYSDAGSALCKGAPNGIGGAGGTSGGTQTTSSSSTSSSSTSSSTSTVAN